MKKINFCAFLAILFTISALSSCSHQAKFRKISGSVWHTAYNITYRSERNLDDSVTSTLRRVELSLSPFEPGSLISAVNRGEAVTADSLLRKVMDASRRVFTNSSGAFDPTVAPLVNLWGFGWTGDGGGTAPSSESIDSVMAIVGIDKCGISADGFVIKKHPATQFNFSAITKGLGCDEVAAMLQRNGCRDYMVEIGGEIAVGGTNPRGEAWHIMIDAPCDTAVKHSRLTVIELPAGGIATSGNYRNYRDTDKGRVGHTINPSTGYPQTGTTLSASVIAPNAMLADAYATACMVLQADSAMAMIERIQGVEALLVENDSTILRSSGWPKEH